METTKQREKGEIVPPNYTPPMFVRVERRPGMVDLTAWDREDLSMFLQKRDKEEREYKRSIELMSRIDGKKVDSFHVYEIPSSVRFKEENVSILGALRNFFLPRQQVFSLTDKI